MAPKTAATTRSAISARRDTVVSGQASRATRAAGKKASAISAATSNERSRSPSDSASREERGISTQEDILLRLREKALKGDARSLDRPVALAQIFINDAAAESLGEEAIAAEDQAIRDAYAAEIKSRSASADAIAFRSTDDGGPNADG
jgi:hypothetical protein